MSLNIPPRQILPLTIMTICLILASATSLAGLAMELAFGFAAGFLEFRVVSRRHPVGRAEFTAEHRRGCDLDQGFMGFEGSEL